MFSASLYGWATTHVVSTEGTAGCLIVSINVKCSLKMNLTLFTKNEIWSWYRSACSSIGVRIGYTSSRVKEVIGDLFETFLVKLDEIRKVFKSFLGDRNMGSRREIHLSWFSA